MTTLHHTAQISRDEAVELIRHQFTHYQKPSTHHYGLMELRDLLDAIYGPFDPERDKPLEIRY